MSVLGIPDRSRGCLLDLEGVLTQTAKVDGTRAFLQARGTDLPEGSDAVGEAGADIVVRDLAELLDDR